jgi:two-component system CheB/CheR fusion protein
VSAANDSFYRAFQVRREDTENRLIYELGNREWDIPELRRLLENVLPTDKQFADFEVEHQFEQIGRRVMLLNARRLDAEQLILLAIEDVTERKRAEEERELLASELSHRVKNTLAVVQSLAMQTNGRNRSVKAFREAFVGRLQALARAHSILLDANWRSADLKTLVGQTVEAYRIDHPEQVEVEGEPVTITPRQGLGLSLVLHELGTNAVKYGALSRQDGCLRVSWRVEGDNPGQRLRLQWQERGGPRAETPSETGFGTEMIQGVCTYELEGEVELKYAPQGLACEIVFPLE